MFEDIVFSCNGCSCRIWMKNDDYFCPKCKKLFCIGCIDSHGCKVKIYPSKYIHQKWRIKVIDYKN